MTDWSRIVRQSLIGLEPYRPGASIDELKEAYGLDEIVKLNWNEGLEGPFPGVEDAVTAELERAWMYPAEAYSGLRESARPGWDGVLRDAMGVDGDGGVYLGTSAGTVSWSIDSGDSWATLPTTFPRVLSVHAFAS